MTTSKQCLSSSSPAPQERARWEGLLTNLADLAWMLDQGDFSLEVFQAARRHLDEIPLAQVDYGHARLRLDRAAAYGRRGEHPRALRELRGMMGYMLQVAGRDL